MTFSKEYRIMKKVDGKWIACGNKNTINHIGPAIARLKEVREHHEDLGYKGYKFKIMVRDVSEWRDC